jgi:hypothetical protein
MANEPERPIEQLLRAAAKKRRDEAGAALELHPATRRLLQGEVTRQYAKAAPDRLSFMLWLCQVWPRIAWGAGMFVVLAVTVWLLVPMPGKNARPAGLARNQPAPLTSQPQRALQPSPAAPAPAAAPTALDAQMKAPIDALAGGIPPASGKPAAEVALQTQPMAKDGFGAVTGSETKARYGLRAMPQPANREQTAGANLAAATSVPAEAPAATANGVSSQPLGSVGQAVPIVAPRVASASPSSLVSALGSPVVTATDESAKLALDRRDQPGFAYDSLSTASTDNSSLFAAASTNALLKSTVALQREAGSGTVTQWFAQMQPTTKNERSMDDKAAPARPVLTAFRVEQAGRQLRVIDGDGSVYTGSMQVADAARRQPAVNAPTSFGSRAAPARGIALKEESTGRMDADQLLPQTYYFRVAGTNRSLQQKVVFTGNFLGATNIASFQMVTNDVRLGGSLVGFRGGAEQPGFLPFANPRISGKVVVGNGPAVEINAVPRSP